MNPESPNSSRDELELKITALLLGELDQEEAKRIRQAMAEDPGLKQLHDQLKKTIGLIKAAAVDLSDPSVFSDSSEPLRLPGDKRAALLSHFKVTVPKAFSRTRKTSSGVRLLELAAVLAILAVLAAMMLPALSKSKSKAHSVHLLNNLHQIEMAKDTWAHDTAASPEAVPTRQDLEPYLGRWPEPVQGETYQLGNLSEPVVAELPSKPSRGSMRWAERVELADGSMVYRLSDPAFGERRQKSTFGSLASAVTKQPDTDHPALPVATSGKLRRAEDAGAQRNVNIALPVQTSSELDRLAYSEVLAYQPAQGVGTDNRGTPAGQPAGENAWYGRFGYKAADDKSAGLAGGSMGIAADISPAGAQSYGEALARTRTFPRSASEPASVASPPVNEPQLKYYAGTELKHMESSETAGRYVSRSRGFDEANGVALPEYENIAPAGNLATDRAGLGRSTRDLHGELTWGLAGKDQTVGMTDEARKRVILGDAPALGGLSRAQTELQSKDLAGFANNLRDHEDVSGVAGTTDGRLAYGSPVDEIQPQSRSRSRSAGREGAEIAGAIRDKTETNRILSISGITP